MTSGFTSNDLLRYVYGETSVEETLSIECSLNSNWNLKEQLEELNSSVNILDKFKLRSPSDSSIEMIMRYNNKARAEELETSF